jgi:SAM-dependent methyltransferase
MPTLPSDPTLRASHEARQAAESFGTDPDRYDRTRPRYPRALVDSIIASLPGRDVLDVGIGTGVSAEPFRTAGCGVLGVEVDLRMAEFARRRRFEVEVARFEDWDPASRSFDGLIAGMTWHWIDPVAGAAKAAAVLRPNGFIALFWNVAQPPAELAQAFSDVYRRVLPDTPFAAAPRDPVTAYERLLETTSAAIQATRAFSDPGLLRFDWERSYTTEEWLDQVPTFGGHSTFPPGRLAQLLSGIRTAIDNAGGAFTTTYAALAITARRRHEQL